MNILNFIIIGGFLIFFAGLIIYTFSCISKLENKNENGYNRYNSNMAVQCNAEEKCSMRFTYSCASCAHNCGRQRDKNCYEPRA